MEKTIKVSARTHGRLKIYCAQSGETMQSVVDAAITEHIKERKRKQKRDREAAR